MKTMCPPCYHNGSVATHGFEHMMYGCNIVYHVPKCMIATKPLG